MIPLCLIEKRESSPSLIRFRIHSTMHWTEHHQIAAASVIMTPTTVIMQIRFGHQ